MNNKNFLVRLGKSVLEFIKATFCGYKVSAAMVSQPFLSEDGTHRNSIFSKEYRKKLDDRPVVILSPTIDLASLIIKGEYKQENFYCYQ
jgi:hypothetical protein